MLMLIVHIIETFALITVMENRLFSIDTDGQQLWTSEHSVANCDADAYYKYNRHVCIDHSKGNHLSSIDTDGQQLWT